MRAGIYLGQRNVTVAQLEDPVCGDRDIVVKNLYASICGTDVAVYCHGPNTGHRITVGGEFGHEVVSQVVQVGREVQGIAVGDVVYPYPLLARGDTSRAGTIGGFSEYILIPDCVLNRQVYKVSGSIPTRVAAMIEPFTVGTRAARRGMPKPGENAVVFGAGTIGMAAALALKHIFGCAQVMVCDLSDFRLMKASELGLAICRAEDENMRGRMAEYFGQAHGLTGMTPDVDIFIDAAGAASILETFMAMGKIGSRFVAVAVNKALREVDLLHLTYAQKSIIGSGGYMPEDVRDVMQLMARGDVNLEALITHEFPLSQLQQALETASDTSRSLNVVINHAMA
ncbi:MAG: zinc-binding dehydrogenase [Aristaeellaceae bacterium]